MKHFFEIDLQLKCDLANSLTLYKVHSVMYYLFLRVYKHSRFILKEFSEVSLWSYLLDLVLMYCRHWVLELKIRVFSRACKFFIVKGYHRNFRNIHIILCQYTLWSQFWKYIPCSLSMMDFSRCFLGKIGQMIDISRTKWNLCRSGNMYC